MRATTSSNGGSKIGWYKSSVTGVLTVNGKSLGVQSSSGTTSAAISGSGVNGYNYGNGTHQAHCGSQTWTGYTNM